MSVFVMQDCVPPGAFFYGTLLHPKVLKRVINNDGNHLSVTPAILQEHTRHHIEGEDYPGMLPYTISRPLFDRELSSEDCCVRGTLVYGLSEADIALLDDFEGDEYTRKLVHVHPLSLPSPLNSPSVDSVPNTPPSFETQSLLPAVSAYTYMWSDSIDRVVPELWSYETFMKDNAWKWTGESSSTGSSDEKGVEEPASDFVDRGGDTVRCALTDAKATSGGSRYFSQDEFERRKRLFSKA